LILNLNYSEDNIATDYKSIFAHLKSLSYSYALPDELSLIALNSEGKEIETSATLKQDMNDLLERFCQNEPVPFSLFEEYINLFLADAIICFRHYEFQDSTVKLAEIIRHVLVHVCIKLEGINTIRQLTNQPKIEEKDIGYILRQLYGCIYRQMVIFESQISKSKGELARQVHLYTTDELANIYSLLDIRFNEIHQLIKDLIGDTGNQVRNICKDIES
jgi:hypothetical protein